MNPSPPGQRSIDSRLASKPVTNNRNSARREGRVPSKPKRTRASDPTVKATTEDPTPAKVEENTEVPAVIVEVEAVSEDSKPMDAHDAEVQPEEPVVPLIPVEPAFTVTDVREKRENRRKYLVKMLIAFNKERIPRSGTKSLTKFLQDMTVPRKCISELIPEEVENLSESEMQKTILRVQTLSNSALESKKDKDSLKKKPAPTSTCGELLGQPRDSSAPEVNLDLGDSHEEKLELESSPRRSASRTDQVDGMEEQTLHQHQHQDQRQQLQRQQVQCQQLKIQAQEVLQESQLQRQQKLSQGRGEEDELKVP